MTIGGYLYVVRGEKYDLPYIECIKSLLPLCDEVVVLTDIQMNDGTLETLVDFAGNEPKVKLIKEKFDWDNPGIDGVSKAIARSHCTSDWLIQMDADEILRQQDISKIKLIISSANSYVDIISLGVLNWFNGNHIKVSSPAIKPRLSRNLPYITHGIPLDCRINSDNSFSYYASEQTDGAGYIHNEKLTPIQSKSTQCSFSNFYSSLQEDVWIHHYSWYSLPRKWSMKPTWHYMWGVLHGLYKDVEDYTINPDGETVDFWTTTVEHKQLPSFKQAISDEMSDDEVLRCEWIEHESLMSSWRKRQLCYGKKRDKLEKKGKHSIIGWVRNKFFPQYDF